MKSSILTGIHWLALTGGVWAAGYCLPNQDAFATAKGNAFVATADNASAVHYNAAGLTQLESMEVELGVYAIQLGNEAKIGWGKHKTESEWQAAPHLYLAGPLGERWAWGIGVNSPFGLGNDWGQFTPFRTVVTEARLLYSSTTGALAYKISDCLSAGASVSVNYLDLTLEQGLGFKPMDYLRFDGDGFSLSGSLSLRWQPYDQHAFGVAIFSETTPSLDGKARSNLLRSGSAKMDFMTPFRAVAGYSYRPAPGWNIEANVEWLDWDSLNTLMLRAPGLPGRGMPVPFQWKSTFIYELGVSYMTADGWMFAGGFDYNENAQPDATYTPGVADADRYWFNIGMGRKLEKWSWFLTCQFGYSNRTVTGAMPTLAGQTANGKYEARHHAIVFSWNRKF